MYKQWLEDGWKQEQAARAAEEERRGENAEFIARRLRQRELAWRDWHSRELFMESEGYFLYDPKGKISSSALYGLYCRWCEAQEITPKPQRALLVHVKKNQEVYHLRESCNIPRPDGGHVRGFRGIRSVPDAAESHP